MEYNNWALGGRGEEGGKIGGGGIEDLWKKREVVRD